MQRRDLNIENDDSQVIEVDKNSTPEVEAEETFTDWKEKKQQLKNKHRQQNQDERIKYSKCAFRLSWIWMVILAVFILAQFCFHKGLTQSEFITLLTTTTASIFGNWYLVGKYLFNREKRDQPFFAKFRKHSD